MGTACLHVKGEKTGPGILYLDKVPLKTKARQLIFNLLDSSEIISPNSIGKPKHTDDQLFLTPSDDKSQRSLT